VACSQIPNKYEFHSELMISTASRLILLLGITHCVDVGSVTDVSGMYDAIVFRGDVNRASEFVYACTMQISRIKSTSRKLEKMFIGRLNDAEEGMDLRETGCNEVKYIPNEDLRETGCNEVKYRPNEDLRETGCNEVNYGLNEDLRETGCNEVKYIPNKGLRETGCNEVK
jgi:hypothetical protein